VNRVWHHLFGEGLVATTDNFGRLGEEPSHPELLDHLAWRFRHEMNWSLKTLVREKEVELIVVGLPRNMDGSYGPAAQRVREFVIALKEAVPMPIRTWDERLTSVTANRLLSEGNVRGQDRKEKVDKVAAAVLLQSYLDSASLG
jgi:putative transcription antitermination factor YqgF